ncbi:hypothetical protein RUND412_003936 [Rhizina undulata]
MDDCEPDESSPKKRIRCHGSFQAEIEQEPFALLREEAVNHVKKKVEEFLLSFPQNVNSGRKYTWLGWYNADIMDAESLVAVIVTQRGIRSELYHDRTRIWVVYGIYWVAAKLNSKYDRILKHYGSNAESDLALDAANMLADMKQMGFIN